MSDNDSQYIKNKESFINAIKPFILKEYSVLENFEYKSMTSFNNSTPYLEKICIKYKNGSEKYIDITGDSIIAIMKDISKYFI